MLHLAYVSLGDHRGHRRLWLEGRKLEDAGFRPAMRYDADIDATRGIVRLIQREDGGRMVAQRQREGQGPRPIIDLANAVLDRALGHFKRARVAYRPGEIEIAIHPFDRFGQTREAKLAEVRREGHVRTGGVCVGAGILDQAIHAGLEEAGLHPHSAFAVEIDERYQDLMLERNGALSGTCSVLGSLDEIEPSTLPPIDVLIAGLPCTAASLSGRAKKGAGVPERDEDVGHLIVPFLGLIRHAAPVAVVLENVLPYRHTASYEMAKTTLRRFGYRLHEAELSGPAFGAMERRDRLCLLAVDPSLPVDLLEGLIDTAGGAGDGRTMADILNTVEEDDPRWRDVSYLARKEERDLAGGRNFRRQLVDGADRSIGVIGRGYWKWRSTEPMVPHPSKPTHARLLSPAEHARCKGIDEGLVEGAVPTTAHEVLGQAVIPAAFRAVGAALGRALRRVCDTPKPHTADLPLFASRPVSAAA